MFSALQVLLAHEEVERHGDQEAAEAEEDLVEVGLDEEPEADEDGDDGDDGTKWHGQGARVLRVAPAQDEDGQAGRHVLGEARDDADGGQGREASRQGDEDADDGREEDGHVRRVEAVVAREDWRQHVVVGDGDDDARRQEGRGQVDAADGDERTGGDEQAAARAEEDGGCRRDRRLRLREVRAEHADGHGHDEEVEGRDEQHDDDDGAWDVALRVVHILRCLGDGLEAREGVEDQERGRAEREVGGRLSARQQRREVRAVHVEDADGDEEHERQQLADRHDVVDDLRELDAQDVDEPERTHQGDDDEVLVERIFHSWHDSCQRRRKAIGHGRPGDDADGGLHEADFKADEVAEGGTRVDVRAAVALEAAAGLGEAERQRHRQQRVEEDDDQRERARECVRLVRQQEDA